MQTGQTLLPMNLLALFTLAWKTKAWERSAFADWNLIGHRAHWKGQAVGLTLTPFLGAARTGSATNSWSRPVKIPSTLAAHASTSVWIL